MNFPTLATSLGLILLLTAIIFAPKNSFSSTRNLTQRLFSGRASAITSTATFRDLKPLQTISQSPAVDMSTTKTPVYFLSHGGPNIMYDTEHPVYSKLQEIGLEITQKVKPKAIVVFSAHWEGERDMVEINTAVDTELIYDFYGFPAHYYTEKFPNKGSKEVAEKVILTLAQAGIMAQPVRRGLDHGVFAVFKVAFSPQTNPLFIPIIQVSLYATSNPNQHYTLGAALTSLRSQNICIIASGMAVHNLRDMRLAMSNSNRPLPYTISFDAALKDAVTAPVAERGEKMAELLQRKDARQAHPSWEHLLPIHVAAGAAGEDLGTRIWTLPEGSFSWAQYRFGEVAGDASL